MELLAGYSTSDMSVLVTAYGPGHVSAAGHSPWPGALLMAGVGAVLVAAVAGLFVNDPTLERRIYWVGWLIATPFMSLAVLSRGWQASLAIAVLCGFTAVVYAYLRTPFLKIGQRIYAVSNTHRQSEPPESETDQAQLPSAPQDSYPTVVGPVSAHNLWWVLVALAWLVAIGVYLLGWIWQMVLPAAFLTLLAGLAGVDDATRELPMARGQYAQAFLVSVACVLLWLAPPVCYVLGYSVGQHWPMGAGKHVAGRDPDETRESD